MYLRYFCVLESLLGGNGAPVNVCFIARMLDNGKKEHGFLGSGLLLLGSGVCVACHVCL